MAGLANIRVISGDERFGAAVAGPEIADDAALHQRGTFGRSHWMKTACAPRHLARSWPIRSFGFPGQSVEHGGSPNPWEDTASPIRDQSLIYVSLAGKIPSRPRRAIEHATRKEHAGIPDARYRPETIFQKRDALLKQTGPNLARATNNGVRSCGHLSKICIGSIAWPACRKCGSTSCRTNSFPKSALPPLGADACQCLFAAISPAARSP